MDLAPGLPLFTLPRLRGTGVQFGNRILDEKAVDEQVRARAIFGAGPYREWLPFHRHGSK